MSASIARKPKLLCSAQTFGYGPIAKLFSVARIAKENYSLYLLLDSDRNKFPQINPGIFEEVRHAGSIVEMETAIDEIKPDSILSAYEPDLILAAARKNIQSYFIDGLFWFWKIGKSAEELGKICSDLVAADSNCLGQLLNGLTPHERIFISHFITSRSFVQFDPGIHARIKEFDAHIRPEVVGAIINPWYGGENKNGEHVLVSLSGQVLPTVSYEQNADYAQIVLKLIAEISEKYFSGAAWIVLLNPIVRGILNERGIIFNDKLRMMDSVSQEAMTDFQRKALVVFSSPGLTTVYECAAFGVPLVFLPEQSVQYENAHRLASYGYPVLGGFFHDEIQYEMLGNDGDGLRTLYRTVIPNLVGMPASIREKLYACCEELEGRENQSRVAALQKSAVLKMVGNFDGANQIAAAI